MNLRYILGFCLLTFITPIIQGQELAYNGNPDDSFFNARELAFKGNHDVARDTLELILSRYPDYSDVRSLLARTYSWDGDFNEARKHFNRITSRERNNKEVWVAAVKNEIYAENYPIALGLSFKALQYLKEDPDLLAIKEQILERIAATQKAGQDQKDENEEKEAEKKVYKNRIGFINSIDVFDVVYDPMIYSSIEYTRDTGIGKIIPRVNYSNRFNINGVQYELDAYPKFSERLYGYLNYGYSDAAIFPRNRAGAELYAKVGSAMEVSGGLRYLDFNTSKTTIYTGSFGLYKGNYYFSFRPYITPASDNKTGVSGNILARKYGKDKENYLGLSFGMGFAPELLQLNANNVLLAETLLYVESQQVLLEYQFTTKKQPNVYRANLGVTRQEFVSTPNSFFWAFSAGMRYQFQF